MIASRTEMRDFPKNCAECTQAECQLPRKNGKISKRYQGSRHPNCSLRDVTPVPENRKMSDTRWLNPAMFEALQMPVSIEYIHCDRTQYTPRVISISHGDLILLANAMFDYANILDDHRAQCLDRQAQPVLCAQREDFAARFRKIGTKITDQIGYDRQLAMAKRTSVTEDTDVGEEALTLAFKAAERKARAEAQEAATDERGE